jgi:hypothetical protein
MAQMRARSWDPDLGQYTDSPGSLAKLMWQNIRTAPSDCDIELAVLDYEGPHALVFPCRRVLGGWVNAETERRIDVQPTHWREWHAS